ncbi:hypothetical protein THRCLA_07918 [Thraustotheca clavata]|uniref:RRM domain-containing protein n=1 Tax=Thraustotheca clavata TaxID=74557 RepID=A0A1V9ZBL4_9STRA|nr:hypothetical protein THRCLA_07918 [Thraustotheca clavata]
MASNSATSKARMGTAKERSVFVGNIPYDVTEDMLREIFSEAGPVLNFRLVTDRETGKPKGYGFCEYGDGATALSAMRNLNGYEINGRNLRVDFADGGERQGTDRDRQSGVTGEAIIKSIEAAIAAQGRVALYDMLVQFREYARTKPEMTKTLLNANPVLAHAIIESYKMINIQLLKTPTQSTLFKAPPPSIPNLSVPRPRPVQPTGGILGVAPPMASQMPPQMPPPMGGLMPVPAGAKARDPRDPRARRADPRMKRDGPPASSVDVKRQKHDNIDPAMLQGLAPGMTPEKIAMLNPNERKMLLSYMEQAGLPVQYQ